MRTISNKSFLANCAPFIIFSVPCSLPKVVTPTFIFFPKFPVSIASASSSNTSEIIFLLIIAYTPYSSASAIF